MKLQDVRKMSALTQEELAQKVGVKALTISAWEIGRRHPKPAHIRALAAALGMTVPEMIFILNTTQMAHEVTTNVRRDAGDSIAAPQGV